MDGISVLDVQSIVSRDTILLDHFHNGNTDVGIITKTCLSDSANDEVWLEETDLNEGNYFIIPSSRSERK